MRVFGLLNLIALLSTAAQADPVHLDLEACVRTAIRNSTSVLKSENDVTLSGEALLQSYAQFLPSVDTSAAYGYDFGTNYYTFEGAQSVFSKYSQLQFGVSTTLNLFNGFSDYAHFKASRDREDASRFTLTRAKQQIATDVTQSYYQLVLDRQIVDIDQKNLEADQARMALLNEEADVGTATLADAVRQQAQVAQDQSLLLGAQTRLHDDELSLLQKLRLDPKETYEFAQPDLVVPKSELSAGEKALLSSALEERTDYKASDSTAKAADFDIQTARADYYPKLNLGFAANGLGTYLYSQYSNGANTQPSPQSGLISQLSNQILYTVQLTLTWNIFDRGLTRLNVSRARINSDNSGIDLEDKRLQVLTEIRQEYGDYASAEKNLTATIDGNIAAAKAYAIIQGRYKVAASSYVDLIAAQAQYVTAQITEAQARVSLKFQSKLLEFYSEKPRSICRERQKTIT